MDLIVQEKKYNFLKVIEKVNEYKYVDKYDRPLYIIYKFGNGKKIVYDVKRKREQKKLRSPLIYNMKEISNVKNSKRHKTIVFVESEELADLINRKSKSLVATTIYGGIDKFHVTEKVSNIFKDTDIIIASQYDNVYSRVFNELFEITRSISIFNYKYVEPEEVLSKKELQITKILNSQKTSDYKYNYY